MKNRTFLSTSNYRFIFFLGIFLLGIGCSDKKETDDPTPMQSIIDFISSDAFKESATVKDDVALDSLNKYLKLQSDLVTLFTESAEHTLFAPSNKAFKDLASTEGFPSDLSSVNPALINGILRYHVVAGTKLRAELKEEELSSLFTDPSSPDAPQKISVNSDGTLKPGLLRLPAKIVATDNKALNGVVHVIDKVLVPSSTENNLTALRGTMASYIFISNKFLIIYKLIQFADKEFTEVPAEGKFKIATWLAMSVTTTEKPTANTTGITFLVLSDEIIDLYAEGESTFMSRYNTPDLARNFLLNHMIRGQYSVGDIEGATKLADGLTLTTLGGKMLTVKAQTPTEANPGIFTISTEGGKTVELLKEASDVSASAGVLNGILHFISGAGLDPD